MSEESEINCYIIIDANEEHEWRAILESIAHWKISIGALHPESCDCFVVSDEDVALLTEYASVLVSDRDKYKNLSVIFVDVRQGTVEEIVERIENGLANNRNRYI